MGGNDDGKTWRLDGVKEVGDGSISIEMVRVGYSLGSTEEAGVGWQT